MKTRLAGAAHDVLDYGSYPTASVLGGFPAARVLYDMAVFSPHLSLVSWRHSGIAERRCLACTAIPCQIRERSQS
ncbi:MAG TPA: hypothetical protein VGF82_18450 [Terracidiphilus sp.]|jgi:phosphoribosyl-dephospho-CoA transferase